MAKFLRKLRLTNGLLVWPFIVNSVLPESNEFLGGLMLVTFTTKGHADITMFGDVARTLLKMMGHSGTIPSALLAEDVPAALERLSSAIAKEKSSIPKEDKDSDKEPDVSLANRALPLINLLSAAVKENANVMWS
jgi:Domain of unknown function (DUF1840)